MRERRSPAERSLRRSPVDAFCWACRSTTICHVARPVRSWRWKRITWEGFLMRFLIRHSYFLLIALLGVALLVGGTGCARNEAAQPQAQMLPQVTVAAAISRKVTDSNEFTGRFEAVERVEVRPRVSGYISSVNFKEGTEVRKGDVLFVIDPRPYQAVRDRAAAGLAQARSQLALARSERERATKLLAQRALSQEEYDTRTAGNEQAEANVEAAKAALDSAALDLEFSRVTAPISGRISRALVTRQLRDQRPDAAHDAGVSRSHLRELRRGRAGVPQVHQARARGFSQPARRRRVRERT